MYAILMSFQERPFFSIIIPTFNEEENRFFRQTLKSFSPKNKISHHLELIIIDKCSQDQTAEMAKEAGAKVILSKHNTRAGRLNEGLLVAKGKLIILHHPRSIIDLSALRYLKDHFNHLSWGGLTHQFDKENLLLDFTSWYSNQVRGKLKQILYLDHCLFFRTDLLNKHFKTKAIIPEVDIFEDTLLSHKLQQIGDATIIPYTSMTSSIRFHKNGLMKQLFLNQLLKVAYFLGIPYHFMNKVYEKNLFLNSTYHFKKR